jgi:fatty acid desaturase
MILITGGLDPIGSHTARDEHRQHARRESRRNQWLPHHPHNETDRYRNTRVNVFTLSTQTLLEQDHHLMHHLFPRVPWYRYRRLFTEMRPLLEKNNARIEGRRLGAGVPKIALR